MNDIHYDSVNKPLPLVNLATIKEINIIYEEFKKRYEIWVRIGNFQRNVSVGIVKDSERAVIITVFQGGRTYNYTLSVLIQKVESHFTSNAAGDLVIGHP